MIFCRRVVHTAVDIKYKATSQLHCVEGSAVIFFLHIFRGPRDSPTMDFNDTILVSRTPRFAGLDTDDWEGWIARFEALTSEHGDEGRLKRLLPLLDGLASDCAQSQLKLNKSYCELRKHLGERFGRSVDPLEARAALGGVRQAPGETVANFADRIEKLGRAAFPPQAAAPGSKGSGSTEPRKFLDEDLASRLICGLRDEWLQAKLCHRRPGSLSEAVSIVNELNKRQEVVQAVRAAGQSPVTQKGCAGVRSAVSAVDAEPDRVDASCSDGRVAQLEQEIANLRYSMETLVAAASSRTGAELSRDISCYRCGAPGHMRRDCPAARRAQPRPGTGDVICFCCGERGHIRIDCPFKEPGRGPRRPFCLACGRSGHWMAACRSLTDHVTQSAQGGRQTAPTKPTDNRQPEN